MGNCLSKREQPKPQRTKQAILTPQEPISTPLQTIPTSPEQTVSTPPQTTSAASQILLNPPQMTISPTPTDLLAAGNLSMFTNAHSPHITGGSFNITTTNVNNTGDGPSLEGLFKRVASNAILNAGGRADEVKCHPGTREEVIDRIEKWGDALDDTTAPIFWLSGPAGAGKSAIVQTVAERCKTRRVPHGNFFFFRADASRSGASPLIATLLYQLILFYPSLRYPIAALLSADPLIFTHTLEDQLEQLLVVPLYSIRQSSSSYRPVLLLIDGLDECDSESKRSQQQILRAFDKILAQRPRTCPFRLLVASRDEPQIQAAFNRLSSSCAHLYLDDQYLPENDIRIFVTDKFEDIRKAHHLAYTLATTWPLSEDVDYIVKKSSGHFIYAATVMRFITDSPSSPKLSLERVKGAAQLASKSPFSHLDAIYTYILTQVDDQEAVRDILHAQLLISKLSAFDKPVLQDSAPDAKDIPLMKLLSFHDLRYTDEIILSCFADLTAIARYPHNAQQLLFYHASFSDYLLDRSRSGDYFVDIAAFNSRISPKVWESFQDRDSIEPYFEWIGILSLIELQIFPPGLFNKLASSNGVWRHVGLGADPPIFNMIYKHCTTDNDTNDFKRIIRQWINTLTLSDATFNVIKDIPFAHRYFHMARTLKGFNAPDDAMMAAICPTSDYDRHELTLWLNDLLQRIHTEIQPSNPERYDRLSKAWISWARENNIPCHDLDDVPEA